MGVGSITRLPLRVLPQAGLLSVAPTEAEITLLVCTSSWSPKGFTEPKKRVHQRGQWGSMTFPTKQRPQRLLKIQPVVSLSNKHHYLPHGTVQLLPFNLFS